MKNIDVVIPFCTYDSRYINRVIDGVKNISENIYVTYCTNLFNGDPENMDLIDSIVSENKDCNFIKFNFNPSKDGCWHNNNARWIASQKCKSEYILYIDADEVFEPDKIKLWINNRDNFSDVTTFATYWYFRSEKYQAKSYEDSPLMVNKNFVNEQTIFHGLERGVYKYINSNDKEFSILGLDGKPMCHHYSWALNKDEMLAKVKNWSHSQDKNWTAMVEEEFSRDFNGTDFVHGYEYNILP